MEVRVVSALVGAWIALLFVTMFSVIRSDIASNKEKLDYIHSQVTDISHILSNAEITQQHENQARTKEED